jgi:predicted transcriptional regulator
MCFEVQYWTNFQKKKDAVNLGKNFMMNAITALEFMNERYDPFGLKLKGWSDQMQIGQDGYSDVFGELYEKYKSSGKKIEPEIKLLLMISASAVSFHASKKMAEQLPGLDKVLESNPELLSKLQGAINNGISKNENDEPSIQEKQKKMYEQMQNLKAQQNKFNELKKQQEKIDSNTERLKQQMNNNNSNNNSNQKSNSKDISSILDRIRAQNAVNNADNVLNNDTSDSSDRVSVESTLGKEEVINNTTDDNDSAKGDTLTLGSDGQPKTRKRRGKPTISIST